MKKTKDQARINALSATSDENLNVFDREFAFSLAIQHSKFGLSEKQWEWIDKLTARARGEEPDTRPKEQLTNVRGLASQRRSGDGSSVPRLEEVSR